MPLVGLLITIILVLGITSSRAFTPLTDNYNIRPTNSLTRTDMATVSTGPSKPVHEIENVLFIECGFGNDSHGQSATKAAVRACRNAIEFNSIPSIQRLVPGGYEALKLHVILAVPPQYQSTLDLEPVRAVFPYYGSLTIDVQDGGMVAPSGIAIDALGDINDDMVVVCAAVTVGY